MNNIELVKIVDSINNLMKKATGLFLGESG